MDEIVLRDFQHTAIDDLTTAAAHGKTRLLLQAPTGSGKTIIASRIISHAESNGKRVLFLAHRRELVSQCAEKLYRFGVTAGVIMSGEPWDPTRMVNVASIQTLHAWAVRRKKIEMPPADLVVIDESHHYNSSKTWQDIVGAYRDSFILGMTATPINRRGRGLGHYFDEMIRCPTIQELTDQGFLVPARYCVPAIPDLQGLKVVAGDYVESQLDDRMNTPKLIGDICENWSLRAKDRQTLVFASGVKHSIHLAQAFNAIGVKAAHVDGSTPSPERDEIVRAFTRGDIQVLSNCAVFTEGTDIPSASCLVFARPTKSLLLYLQVAGRVLRTHPGKSDCLILDHAGVFYEHGRVNQDWEWRLDYGDGDVAKSTSSKKKRAREITCENCKEVFTGRIDCPACGTRVKLNGKEVQTWPGYLQEIDEIENPKLDEKSWYQQFLGYARDTGKKPGFAYFKFLDRFDGKKPPYSWRELEPMTPGIEVSAWIKKQTRLYFWKQKNPALAAYNERR